MIYVEFTISGSRVVEVDPDDLINRYPQLMGKEDYELVEWIDENIDNDDLFDWIADGIDSYIEHDTESHNMTWSN